MAVKFFMVLLTLGIFALLVIFNRQILDFSDGYQLRQRTQAALAAENWEKVIPLYEQGVKEHPNNAEMALKLARYYRRNNQKQKAERLYQDILEKHPGHLEALLGYATLLQNDPERRNQAVLQYREALKSHMSEPRLLGRLGSLYRMAAADERESCEAVRKWLYQWAVYYYRLALKREPADYNSRFGLAVTYQQLDNPEDAARQYCNALLIRPNSYESRFNLGLALVDLRYMDAAYRQLDRAVQILMESDRVSEAQKLAEEVQIIKNGLYYDAEQSGLRGKETPDFLKPACLESGYRSGD